MKPEMPNLWVVYSLSEHWNDKIKKKKKAMKKTKSICKAIHMGCTDHVFHILKFAHSQSDSFSVSVDV